VNEWWLLKNWRRPNVLLFFIATLYCHLKNCKRRILPTKESVKVKNADIAGASKCKMLKE
jgi:hypothetical protein